MMGKGKEKSETLHRQMKDMQEDGKIKREDRRNFRFQAISYVVFSLSIGRGRGEVRTYEIPKVSSLIACELPIVSICICVTTSSLRNVPAVMLLSAIATISA